MIWVYGMGYVTSVGIGVLIVNKLWRIATGRITDDELVQIQDSEEEAIVHAAQQASAEPEAKS
jgi:TRAP-type C4-dicarboxylate transport system permease small subunit